MAMMTHPSPSIHNLAPELLSEVFLQCVPDPFDYPLPHLRRDIISSSHVSRRWRATSLSTPRLWSYIFISLAPPSGKIKRVMPELECARAWLARSGDSSLSIFLICSMADTRIPEEVTKEEETINTATQLLMHHCERWRRFTMITQSCINLDIFSSTGVYFARLEYLELPNTWRVPRVIETFSKAPQLREVAMILPPPLHRVKIPWNQLTRCFLNTDLDAVQVLHMSPGLVDLHVQMDDPDDALDQPHPFTHLNLSKLEVRGMAHDTVNKFLSRITLPSLHELIIPEIYTELVPMIFRSACQILKANLWVKEDAPLAPFLQVVTGLQDLTVRVKTQPAWIVLKEALELNLDHQLAPELRSLKLCFSNENPYDSSFVSQLMDVLGSRLSPPPLLPSSPEKSPRNPIKHVKLEFVFGTAAFQDTLLQHLDNLVGKCLIDGLAVKHWPIPHYYTASQGFCVSLTVDKFHAGDSK
ncbi:hypothetical protein FIBSPDRAFT_1050657 [Athelia psychrophila]|uniref:Uncharacterized protein n=1 Tax=Athelia psychrophila TaxID=1759441 RepID=A0A166AI24_9AGAM|nr:hypothetical protein FIBSPDRAFT_1050657 [Fibularhizoctonia sp. CBS 109695]